jgi:hypothetical protein
VANARVALTEGVVAVDDWSSAHLHQAEAEERLGVVDVVGRKGRDFARLIFYVDRETRLFFEDVVEANRLQLRPIE